MAVVVLMSTHQNYHSSIYTIKANFPEQLPTPFTGAGSGSWFNNYSQEPSKE